MYVFRYVYMADLYSEFLYVLIRRSYELIPSGIDLFSQVFCRTLLSVRSYYVLYRYQPSRFIGCNDVVYWLSDEWNTSK